MCTAWIFTATHFAAHRKAFAFHSSTPVSGVSGNFDNSSPNKDRAARWLERSTVLLSRWPDFRRKLVDHLENSPFKRRELPPNHHCQSYVGPVYYTVYFHGTHLTSLVSPNEWMTHKCLKSFSVLSNAIRIKLLSWNVRRSVFDLRYICSVTKLSLNLQCETLLTLLYNVAAPLLLWETNLC